MAVVQDVMGRQLKPDHPKCDVCSSPVHWRVGLHCWGCNRYYHRGCLGGVPGAGVWVCSACREQAQELGIRDLVLDERLMQAVRTGGPSTEWALEEQDRCRAALKWLRWERGKLWVVDVWGHREVPPLYDREAIVVGNYRSLGCPGGDRLYSLLRTQFYWRGMKEDCVRMCAA